MHEQLLSLGPFATVLDVGGNLGDFAASAYSHWPAARITSFEPIPIIAARQRERARGRWTVEEVAISDRNGNLTLHVCVNQHSASTVMPPGSTRRAAFGIRDRFEEMNVPCAPLDAYLGTVNGAGRLLVKIDVEGHERSLLDGADRTLNAATAVMCEVQQDADIFIGAPSAESVDGVFREHGLRFAGVLDALKAPGGKVVQFDGLWTRP